MTARSLHSAVLEVGLHYQKRWSVDEIARFAFRLKRRRLRAEKATARARRVAHPVPLHPRGVAFQIRPTGDSRHPFAEAVSAADARKANQRLFERVRAQLSRRLSRSEERERVDLPCLVCGRRATGWTYLNRNHFNVRAIDGYPTCAAHRSEESLKQVAGTRAR